MNIRTITKWAGRIIGVGASCFFLAFAIGEGIDDLYRNADAVLYLFFIILGLSIAGTVVSWFRPAIGGVAVTLGGILLLTFHLFRNDVFTALIFGAPFILAGSLSLSSMEGRHTKTAD